MLDLQFEDGNRVALPYATLPKITFDPSKAIDLKFSKDDVRMQGHRLEPLYRAILQHRARFVHVSGLNAAFVRGTEDSVVTAIRCTPIE